jgi:hypothetical protein
MFSGLFSSTYLKGALFITTFLAVLVYRGNLIQTSYERGEKDGKASMKAKWDADTLQRKDAEQRAIYDRLQEIEATKQIYLKAERKRHEQYQTELASVRTASRNADRLRVSSEGFRRVAAGDPQATDRLGGNAASAGAWELSETLDRDLIKEQFIIGNGMYLLVAGKHQTPVSE